MRRQRLDLIRCTRLHHTAPLDVDSAFQKLCVFPSRIVCQCFLDLWESPPAPEQVHLLGAPLAQQHLRRLPPATVGH